MKKSRTITIILAILAMLFWGTLFPYIKIGYKAFKVDTSSTADILIFASIRFLICGLLLSVFCLLNRKRIGTPQKHDILQIAIMGFFAIFLHYAFTYIGLSVTDSSKTALLKQLGTLFYVSFAFLFVKEEEYSINKIVGVMVGFFGIVSINSGGGKVSFSYGDILIILASVCTVISSIMSKKSVKNESVLWVTGISQLFGGVLLLLIGIILGGKFPTFSFKAIAVLAYICLASIGGYTLWYYVQRRAELSLLFIIKFAEPLFACIFGAILLHENIFKLQYLFAFLFISSGIFIGSSKIDDNKTTLKIEEIKV